MEKDLKRRRRKRLAGRIILKSLVFILVLALAIIAMAISSSTQS